MSDFIYDVTGDVVRQKTNFSILGASPPKRRGSIRALLIKQSIDIKKLDAYLMRNLGQNPLFGEIFDEFARFFLFSQKERHTQAFLHLYRALERMSYAFPVAYASVSTDYKKTFDQLKSFVLDKNASELKFFRTFVEKTIDSQARQALAVFDVSANQASRRNQYYKSLKLVFTGNQIKADVQNTSITVEYEALLGGFAEMRNRYFHLLSGPGNAFTYVDIPDSDEFFAVVNRNYVNWLAYLYFRILDIRVS